jgi:single stranded DNA-binding protein
MASYNRVILLGNLVRDIELRYTNSKLAVCQNAIAVNERRKNAAGEWVDETSFVDVTFFGRTAEVVAEYLGKGSPIFVEGRLKQDTWEKTDKREASSMLSLIACNSLVHAVKVKALRAALGRKAMELVFQIRIKALKTRCMFRKSATMCSSKKICRFNHWNNP